MSAACLSMRYGPSGALDRSGAAQIGTKHAPASARAPSACTSQIARVNGNPWINTTAGSSFASVDAYINQRAVVGKNLH